MFKRPNLMYLSGFQLLNSPTVVSPHARLDIGLGSRSYATASDHPENKYPWPSTSSFTPYDVFNLPCNAPYSKSRYYDLVKIYHPDRPSDDMTPEIRLQRYKIIVAAHEILSDPAKRATYDQSGAGWIFDPRRESPTDWPPHGPNIYANATWEDWERWNNRHQGKQQHIVDHRTFTRLVILLTLFGGAVQASWISQLNTGYEQSLREVSEDSMRFLTGRRQHTVNQMPSTDARVQSFLIRRDPTGSGLKDDEQSVYQNELHDRRGLSALASDHVSDPTITQITVDKQL